MNTIDALRNLGWNLAADYADETITGEPCRRTVIRSLSTTETLEVLYFNGDGVEKALRSLEKRMARRAA